MTSLINLIDALRSVFTFNIFINNTFGEPKKDINKTAKQLPKKIKTEGEKLLEIQNMLERILENKDPPDVIKLEGNN